MHLPMSIRSSRPLSISRRSRPNQQITIEMCSGLQVEARRRMSEDITKGELVRVIAPGLFKGQECQVLAVEHNTEHHHWFARTWYLLDTRYSGHSWSQPRWVERHEIERVTPEDRGVVE